MNLMSFYLMKNFNCHIQYVSEGMDVENFLKNHLFFKVFNNKNAI